MDIAEGRTFSLGDEPVAQEVGGGDGASACILLVVLVDVEGCHTTFSLLAPVTIAVIRGLMCLLPPVYSPLKCGVPAGGQPYYASATYHLAIGGIITRKSFASSSLYWKFFW